ncbi:MAG: hypothetical protein IPO86_15575 [Saprospiraceae bacterium]|nr:hypothetical protein [Saprospiraceae bacterium]
MKYCLAFFILYLKVAITTLYSQHTQIGFTNYTYDNFGFRTGTVISVYKDPKGYIWFCTLGGLDRWDGTNLKHYPYDRFNTHAMPEALHGNIIMDKLGNYWINNHSCLSMMDPKLPIDSCITRFLRSPNNPNTPILTGLTGAKFEMDDKGNIWLPWNSKQGFLKINPNKRHIDFYQIDDENKTGKLAISTVYPDVINKKMWVVSTNLGFCSIETENNKIEHFENDLKSELMCLWNESEDILKRTAFFWSRDGFFWCLANNKPFTKFDLNARKAYFYELQNTMYPGHPEKEQEFYYQDLRGNYWFTSADHGLLFLDAQKMQISLLTSQDKGGFPLGGKMFSYLTGDDEGNVWISMRNAGVSKFNYSIKKNYLIFPLGPNDTTKNKKYIQNITVDDFGNEYLRTNTGFFIKPMDSSYFIKVNGLPEGGFFFQVDNGEHWFACEQGFFILKTNPVGIEKYPIIPNEESLKIFGQSSCNHYQCENGNPIFWISESKTGLYKYYIEKGTIEFISCDTLIYGGEFNTLPNMIRRDSKNNLWMRLVNGLGRYNIDKKEWSKWMYDPEDPTYLAIPQLRTIMVDKSDRVWFASIEGGAGWFDGERFHHASRTVPGIIPRCFDVIQGKNNTVWFSNNANVVNYDARTGRYKIYDCLGGAQRLTLKNDSTLILGNIEPLTYVAIEDLYLQKNKPKTIISEFRVLEKDCSALLSQDDIELPYFKNALSFAFGTLDFSRSKGYRFSWKLEGADNDWVAPSDNRSAVSYSTLIPGTYTFLVKSTSPEGIMNNDPAKFSFRILPPWWQTWWFRTLILIAAIMIVYWMFRLRTQKLLAIQRIEIEKTLALEGERSRISRDMHDDLGSGLSAIHLLSNYLKENSAIKYPEFSTEVEKILKSSAELNQRIREIIWTINSKDDSLNSMVLFIRRYCNELNEKIKTRIDVFSQDPVPEILLTGEQRKQIFLCVKEAINNALKHGKASEISVYINSEPDKNISIRIQDNGIGFNSDQSSVMGNGNGLNNIKQRMADIKGTMEVNSDNNGTQLKLNFNI